MRKKRMGRRCLCAELQGVIWNCAPLRLDALEEDMPAGAQHVVDGGDLLEAEVSV